MAEPCHFCLRAALSSIAVDSFVGPWSCESCLQRLGALVLNAPPPSLVDLWPVAAMLSPETQRQFNHWAGTNGSTGGKRLQEWDPASQSWALSKDSRPGPTPSIAFYEAAGVLLQRPKDGPRPHHGSGLLLDWVLGPEVRQAFLHGENCHPLALLATAFGVTREKHAPEIRRPRYSPRSAVLGSEVVLDPSKTAQTGP